MTTFTVTLEKFSTCKEKRVKVKATDRFEAMVIAQAAHKGWTAVDAE